MFWLGRPGRLIFTVYAVQVCHPQMRPSLSNSRHDLLCVVEAFVFFEITDQGEIDVPHSVSCSLVAEMGEAFRHVQYIHFCYVSRVGEKRCLAFRT